VVVATRNRRGELRRSLAHLAALPEIAEVVVVDNASSDGTQADVRRDFPHVRLIELDANHGPAARTVGVDATGCEVVAFADDDSWWLPGSLARAGALLRRHPRIGLLAGRVLVGADGELDPTSREMRESPLAVADGLPGVPVLGFVACGAVVRRSAFLDAGGFRTAGIGGEETLLALDLASRGWALRYVDDLVARHFPSMSRDDGARAFAETLNGLTTAWARRPLGPAIRATVRAVRKAGDPPVRRALLQAARDMPGLMRARRPIPAAVERQLQLLERAAP
jgi:GT2 family glycosyltransferase